MGPPFGRHTRVAAFLLAGLAFAGIAKAAMPPEHSLPKTGPRSLVILGASYAGGWGAPQLPGFDSVINRGVSGEETGDMLRRFERDVVAAKPDAVLIWGHVNDITRSAPERLEATKIAAREHYRQMIQKARASGVEVILATEVPWTEPTGLMNDLRAFIGQLRGKQSYAQRVSAHVRELNAFLRELATREKFVLLDFERVFANEEGTRTTQFSAEDGSHISKAGYAALTDYSTRILRRGKK
jgi:lysophospholipase L1-like esterase